MKTDTTRLYMPQVLLNFKFTCITLFFVVSFSLSASQENTGANVCVEFQEAQKLLEQEQYSSAFELLEKCKKDKHVMHTRKLALELLLAPAPHNDELRAESIFREMLDWEGVFAQSVAENGLGIIYFRKGQPLEARDRFKKSAALDPKDRVHSLCTLGDLYEDGSFDESKNFDMAEKYYKLAARTGCGRSATKLGLYYFESDFGPERDLAESAFWFEKANDLGSLDAKYYLGRIFESGTDLPNYTRSPEKALKFYLEYIDSGGGRADAKSRANRLLSEGEQTTPETEALSVLSAEDEALFMNYAEQYARISGFLYYYSKHNPSEPDVDEWRSTAEKFKISSIWLLRRIPHIQKQSLEVAEDQCMTWMMEGARALGASTSEGLAAFEALIESNFQKMEALKHPESEIVRKQVNALVSFD